MASASTRLDAGVLTLTICKKVESEARNIA